MNRIPVMIVEDDLRASYVLENTINQHTDFYVAAACESQLEAELKAEAFDPELIMVDISLPDGSGIDLIKSLKSKGIKAAFIMTTAERETTTIEKAIQLGVMDYLVKPIRMSRVLQALDDYLDFKKRLTKNDKIDQQDIDALFRKSASLDGSRKTPKGIDENTLDKLTQYLETINNDSPFTAEDIGEAINLSRITARRYLEYLEAQGQVSMTLDYKTGGRPKQRYTKMV
ncbi:two-component system response regulator [Marinomonas sp. UCMA 3892]|jgi:response regulator of citrate/malate metabolism|uniref:Transcriptional regulatory protein n=1 Tax=Marinomonas sp. (strain MWYL1) TaxID=400668 RepID=A6VZ25_MARMS|nr:response regulator [Marinomonas sp. UCMA 3892]NLU97195.1 two-component system response regulator [Marinomonas sp. UCMA 3892]